MSCFKRRRARQVRQWLAFFTCRLGCDIIQAAIKAAPRAGMAGRAFLPDPEKQGIAVTVDARFHQFLGMPGGLTLAPPLVV
jgi:hypothetical protein